MSEHVHTPQCKQLLGNLSDFIDGELEEELCAEIEAHLQGCTDCQVVVNTLRKTIELYERCAEPSDLPQDVRERLFYKLELDDYLKKEL